MRRFVRDNSLALVVFGLFFVFLTLQAISGFLSDNAERTQHGQAAQGFLEYLFSGAFVEATFENWESEFLAIGTLAVLGIFLREKGSPESKPVAAPHRQTGSS